MVYWRITHHICVLLQDRELDSGDFDWEQDTGGNARDAGADNGDLEVSKGHSLHVKWGPKCH